VWHDGGPRHRRVTAHLSALVAAPARGSLQAGLKAAQLLAGPHGDALQAAARQAFTEAMSRAALTGAGVALAAALVALILLPARARERTVMTPKLPKPGG